MHIAFILLQLHVACAFVRIFELKMLLHKSKCFQIFILSSYVTEYENSLCENRNISGILLCCVR